jgi:hypothetical protein
MNNQQARFILQGYRPNGADASDETFGDALNQAARDAGLREWFAREVAFDGAVSAKLGELAAPAGLREAILAGAKVTAAGARSRPGWRPPAWLAIAAAVAVIFSGALVWWPKAADSSGALVDFAVLDSRHTETHGGHGEETGALQAALSQPGLRLGGRLPLNVASLHKAGCRTLSFQGRDVLEVCFQRNGAWFHCYIAQRDDFPTVAAALRPAVLERNGTNVAAWADATLLFVVVSESGRAALERLL